MLRTSVRAVLLVAAGALATSGCCKKKLSGDGTDPRPGASGAESGDAPLSDGGHEKLNAVIKCFNNANRISKSAEYYFSRTRKLEPAKGRAPSGMSYKPPQDTAATCDKALNDKKTAMAEIDAVLPEYVPLVKQLATQIEDMDEYYRSKQFEVDKFAKGKEMNASFKSNVEQFEKLHDKLGAAIDTVADKRDDESIAKESAKKQLRYHHLVFLRDAKLLVREVTKDKPDQSKLQELKGKVEASYQAFNGHVKAHPEQTSKAFMFTMYKDRAEEFIGAVRSASAPVMKERELNAILDKYNAMIDASSVVTWRN